MVAAERPTSHAGQQNEWHNLRINDQLYGEHLTVIDPFLALCYLALVTDMDSRKLVGYDISDSLELKGCMRALNKSIYQVINIKGLIHHLDRGIQ